MGPHFMLLISIYVLNFNLIYIYLVSCLVEINLYNLYINYIHVLYQPFTFIYVNSFEHKKFINSSKWEIWSKLWPLYKHMIYYTYIHIQAHMYNVYLTCKGTGRSTYFDGYNCARPSNRSCDRPHLPEPLQITRYIYIYIQIISEIISTWKRIVIDIWGTHQ